MSLKRRHVSLWPRAPVYGAGPSLICLKERGECLALYILSAVSADTLDKAGRDQGAAGNISIWRMLFLPKKESGLGRLEQIAVKTAADMGFELIELELAKEPQGLFLRFLIDKPGGITIDDCEIYHKTVQPYTDHVDFDYMEVSSPGADRPLKKPEDFERSKGKRVEVKLYKPDKGAKRHEGELVGLEEGEVVIIGDKGERLSFAQKAVALVKPLIEFDEEDLQDESAAPSDGEE